MKGTSCLGLDGAARARSEARVCREREGIRLQAVIARTARVPRVRRHCKGGKRGAARHNTPQTRRCGGLASKEAGEHTAVQRNREKWQMRMDKRGETHRRPRWQRRAGQRKRASETAKNRGFALQGQTLVPAFAYVAWFLQPLSPLCCLSQYANCAGCRCGGVRGSV